jgi:hypothetical protein
MAGSAREVAIPVPQFLEIDLALTLLILSVNHPIGRKNKNLIGFVERF